MSVSPAHARSPQSDPAVPAPTDLQVRVVQEHLRLSLSQIRRVPFAVLAADAFIAWLAWSAGQAVGSVVWLIAATAVQFGHSYQAGGLITRLPWLDVLRTQRQQAALFLLVGAVRALAVPLVFVDASIESACMLTMVMIGTAAGSVGTVAGQVRTYVLWSVPVTTTLAAAWVVTLGWAGAWIALLLVLLAVVLTLYVREQGRAVLRLVLLADDQERLSISLAAERDRAVTLARERAELHESLTRERDRAEAESASKTRLFAAASHDLRQPLSALAINATTLDVATRRSGDPLVRELSDNIGRALQQTNTLLEGLLDVSRLDAHVVQAQRKPVDLVRLLRDLEPEMAALAAQARLEFSLDISDAAGRAAGADTDAELLVRVLNNLVGNALKFTTAGGVRIVLRRVPPRWSIEVHDTGCGIPDHEQHRVFEEFYQLGNPTRDRSKGLGLGLSIVKRIAALLDIEVRLTSVVGQGTRFELLVPQAECDDHTLAVDDVDRVELPPVGCKRRVLVVDDEAEVVAAIGKLLDVWGWEWRGAGDGSAALRCLDGEFVPDVLVVDYRLPRQTGFEVIAALRARLGPVPAVVVTGDVAPQRLQAEIGDDTPVLHKPLDGWRLTRALCRAVQAATA